MQANRLFQIVYLLLERGTVTAEELAERFEVTRRTIYRDVDALSSAGIPVYCVKGRGGGVRLLPDFVLNKSVLTEGEQNEILFALQSLRATNAAEIGPVLSRLSGLFRRESGDWIDVDFSRWGSGEAERQVFGLLKTAILEQRTAHFFYHSTSGERSERQVEPVKLCFKNSAWYLQAYCLERREFRTFKICRMDGVELTEDRFDRRLPPPIDPSEADSGPMFEMELWFSERVAYRVCDEFGREAIQRAPGGFRVRCRFPADRWVYGYLLSYGPDIRILSPPEARQALRAFAEQVAGLYAGEVIPEEGAAPADGPVPKP